MKKYKKEKEEELYFEEKQQYFNLHSEHSRSSLAYNLLWFIRSYLFVACLLSGESRVKVMLVIFIVYQLLFIM